ncbi:unnamed protein product [Dibothriocephalus latus]|uniref:MPN domain-containing protein n=1 Tax=Dibothriocephalus latus TaxID=60516 RepID=A0A3P7M5M4_DIBLA|nr:unnamed protein product [Dibothriocephalus latus]
MSTVFVSKLAFAKIILHVSKYPHTAVNGVLLGEVKADGEIRVLDAVPLFHSTLTLAPMLEIAFYQIESYCALRELKICGYYQANELLNANSPNPLAFKIADKIRENNKQACLMMVRNDRLKQPSSASLSLHTFRESKWKESSNGLLLESSAVEFLKPYLTSRALADFSDFDCHLDNVEHDWRNTHLFSEQSECA